MNNFDKKLTETGYYPLRAKKITSILLCMGHRCNLSCTHCYIAASPDNTEVTPLSTIEKVLDILGKYPDITTVDITGGSAELNPHFKYFVKSSADLGKKVIVPSNLTLFAEPEMEDIPEFLAENRAAILASLPGATEETVDNQRGRGTYKKAITSLTRLNELGYGKEGTGLELDIIFNPAKASLAPGQNMLEKVYKEKLMEMHGITFNHLYTLNNMPLGRFRKSLSEMEFMVYMKEMEEKFNPDTVENLMCRSSVAFDPFDGTCYDCDFKRIQKVPVKSESANLDNFDYKLLSNREIPSTPLCFVCTAGAGQECAAKLS